MSEHQLDVKGLLCPMPVIKTQNKAKQLLPGDILKVIATDPGVKQDIPAWCRINKHTLKEITTEGNEIVLIIQINLDK